uniref:Cyclin-dependent kinase 2 homolog n=1 Tax=Chromera velia CCMP2878 TaxID=1169474 RepID=A0A0G4HQ64_9ALVE|eukprot:Cvel_30093.t1-p1 / transcript=Cvel_30093.t1 / gene=Cvel_30093 / organism=Chromera_velia_CCMP2878 / gene_product=Cyclin-dependent kinase C-2, putative / transcript_product=Cyclin-dependent kinase C-2, putative / location=Cvel_scaffold4238:367-1479(-) / protein_length=371 / sequence_SO=supercontig / SO=protein_coding / is_pseudo=false
MAARGVGEDRYVIVQAEKGKGAYGTVDMARDKETNSMVAIKRQSQCPLERPEGQKAPAAMGVGLHVSVIREIQIMGQVRHPNVVGIQDVYVHDGKICTVMPFCDYNLKDFLSEHAATLDQAQVKCLMKQMLSGLKALHEWYVLHRDLKPENVLLTDDGILKLADFGLAREFADDDKEPMTPMVMTAWWRPPELCYDARFYGFASDMWSIGGIFAEILSAGNPLFSTMLSVRERENEHVLGQIFEIRGTPVEHPKMKKVLSDSSKTEKQIDAEMGDLKDLTESEKTTAWPGHTLLPKYIQYGPLRAQKALREIPGLQTADTKALELLDWMLQIDPNKRPTAEEALGHQWFRDFPRPCAPANLPKKREKSRLL